jgi:Ribonuclease G/E
MKKRIFIFYKVNIDFNFPIKPENPLRNSFDNVETAAMNIGDTIIVDAIAKEVWVPLGGDEFAEALTSLDFIDLNSNEKGGHLFTKIVKK